MNRIPTWQLSIITVAVLLSPMLAFLMAIVVEVLIDSLMAAGVPLLLTGVVAGAIGWSLFHKLRFRPRKQATVET
jgi:predicted membrane protein